VGPFCLVQVVHNLGADVQAFITAANHFGHHGDKAIIALD
jgi:hypothetical protein